MGALSVWHWLIVFVIVILFFARGPRAKAAGVSTANLSHSVTQYVSAALHDGFLHPQTVLDRLLDRHRAPLPELGLDVAAVVQEAKVARARKTWVGAAYLLLSLWLIDELFDYPAVVDEDLSPVDYLANIFWVLVVMAGVGVLNRILVVAYLRRRFVEPARTSIALGADNVSIFGGFSPFAGFGLDLDGWSFTIDTSKPVENRSDPPDFFEQVELLDFLTRQLRRNIEQVEIADRLFVGGRSIRHSNEFLSGPVAMPTTQVGPDRVASHVGDSQPTVRHYRVVCLPIAENHLALTMFLRSTMVGSNVFIESRTFLLNSIRPEFTTLNDLSVRRGPGYYAGVVRTELLKSPFAWLSGYGMLFEQFGRLRTAIVTALGMHPEDKVKKRDADYNYGHFNSFRETLASAHYGSYFQMLDKDRALKTSQHIILNGLVEFFESKGIATDDIRERRTQIFNSGVIVSGGVVNAQQMAVGSGATAKAKVTAAVNAARK